MTEINIDDFDDLDLYEDGDNYEYIEDGYAMAVRSSPLTF
jgi:hypothetical protein